MRPLGFGVAAAAACALALTLPQGADASGCCSWSTACDPTTDYCNANALQCERDCQGTWIPDGTPPGQAPLPPPPPPSAIVPPSPLPRYEEALELALRFYDA